MAAIVRILRDGAPVGGGFLTTYDQVFSASHVINEALGRDPMASSSPKGRRISIDFPFANGVRGTATVLRWSPPWKEDVATLLVERGRPDAVGRFLLAPDVAPATSKRVRIYGFPDGYDEGVWTYGVLGHRQATNRHQINIEEELTVQAGFSGCPVLLEEKEAVVGMIVSADVRNKIAFMAPSDYLVRRMHFSEPIRGSKLWEINYFRSRTLSALLNDLLRFERDGIDEVVCETVKQSLGEIANTISVVDTRAFWDKGIDDEIEEFSVIYREWNGASRGISGSVKRHEELKRLRAVRKSISSKIKDAQGLFGTVDDEQMIADIFESLSEIATRNPGMFASVEKALSIFRHPR